MLTCLSALCDCFWYQPSPANSVNERLLPSGSAPTESRIRHWCDVVHDSDPERGTGELGNKRERSFIREW